MKNSVKQMIESSPALASTTIVYTDNFALTITGVLNIYFDLTSEDCDLILNAKRLTQIQFARKRISKVTLKLINDRFLTYDEKVSLRVDLNGYGAFTDLGFLIYLPNLKNLSVDLFDKDYINKINEYLKLDSLTIGSNRISIKEIVNQTSLKRLFVFDKIKDIEIIKEMDWLEKVSFSSQSLKNLDFLIPLKNLKELRFLFGGTKNLEALPNIGKIENLSFMRVRQLEIENLLPINGMNFLKNLSFDSQPHLTDLNWLSIRDIKTEVVKCKNFKP